MGSPRAGATTISQTLGLRVVGPQGGHGDGEARRTAAPGSAPGLRVDRADGASAGSRRRPASGWRTGSCPTSPGRVPTPARPVTPAEQRGVWRRGPCCKELPSTTHATGGPSAATRPPGRMAPTSRLGWHTNDPCGLSQAG